MDIVTTIATAVLGPLAQSAAKTVFGSMMDVIHGLFKEQPEEKILKALEAIGSLSDKDIRRRIDEFARQKKVNPDRAEELAVLLINLAHGARFHTTQGTPRSSFLRCERLLEQLLNRVLPKRSIGQAVAEGYTDWMLTGFLGMGSFGEVWKARNRLYPDLRAFKFFTNDDAKRWIRDEQKTLAHLRAELRDDPNIVTFLNISIESKPYPYLELEFAEGGSVEDWILGHETDRLRIDKLRLIEGIVRGVSHAHKRGICHRDLKPANILMTGSTTDVQPKIADFGLGKVAKSTGDSSASQGSQASMVGTSLYLPPEASLAFVKRDPLQDDVFALGVIWYQLLVEKLERPPYDFAEQLRSRSVDQGTIRVVERCLAHPTKRFRDACDLETALPPSIPQWEPPPGLFDVQHLALEFINSKRAVVA